MKDRALHKAMSWPDFWLASFEPAVQLVGVLEGVSVKTSEGAVPVYVVKEGNDFCLIAGALALSAVEGVSSSECWLYLVGGRCMPEHVKRFASIEGVRGWVADARSEAFNRALFEMVIL
ncbi:hypothetical protein [Caballeronia sp. KNU42]